MKILCLLGSPRPQGNSAAIASHFLEIAKKFEADVQIFDLHQLNYCGCTSCNACKDKTDRCIIKDDLTPVLDAIYEIDVLVITTPVYFGGPNYKVCSFLERTCSFFKIDWVESESDCRLTPGKKLVFIQAQSQPKSEHKDTYSRYEHHFQRLGFRDKDRYFIHAYGVDRPGDVKARDDILQLAGENAQKICA